MNPAVSRGVTVLFCLATIGLSGCGLFRKKTATSPGGSTLSAAAGIPGLGHASDISSFSRPSWSGEGERGLFTPVYFDTDSARIRPGDMPTLEAVASYMRSNPGVQLIIEGHCDERGTAEYNRALGERRALSAREHLVQYGVDPSRVSTISYGKERPAELGSNEFAWAKNRRCEFVVARQ
jgi:peptidoglycan-associated lipoprotein